MVYAPSTVRPPEKPPFIDPRPYFLTVCTAHRHHLFGRVHQGRMQLNDAGAMISRYWRHLPDGFTNVVLDAFVVMPDHLHGLMALMPPTGDAATALQLSDIVHAFTAITARVYAHGVRRHGWLPCPTPLWQPRYSGHVVCDEGDLDDLRRYIATKAFWWTG